MTEIKREREREREEKRKSKEKKKTMEQQVSAKVNDGRNRSRSHFKFVFPFGETASIEGVTARFRLVSVRVSREGRDIGGQTRQTSFFFLFSFSFLAEKKNFDS